MTAFVLYEYLLTLPDEVSRLPSPSLGDHPDIRARFGTPGAEGRVGVRISSLAALDLEH